MNTPITKKPGLRTYQIGFVLSVLLTLTAFALATHHVPAFMATLSTHWMIGIIIALAFVQFVVQLILYTRGT